MSDDLTIKEAAFRVRAQLEEGDAEVLLHAGHARALVEEIERLRGHLDPEACLVRAGKPPGTQTGFEFVVSSLIVRVIANHMAATLKAHGAQNYVEIGFTHEELGPLTLMVQRDRGDTPARKVAERDAEIERLRKIETAARDFAVTLKGGFIACQRCGDQETTADMDGAHELYAALGIEP